MKTSERSSKNKKPVVVFIYGPIAVGKLTVAEILSKRLGYKLLHNHHLNDFVDQVFDRGSHERNVMVEKLRYDFLEGAVKAKINFVTTHCYSHDFVSTTGLSDPKYVRLIAKKLAKLGADFCPVHLKAGDKELLRRVSMESRKKYKKLKDKKIMKKLLITKDWQSSPKLKDNFIIDNTNISPEKVARMIKEHFEL